MTKKPAKQLNLQRAQAAAVRAAQSVGALMRSQLHASKRVNSVTQHDIKLELDVRCQGLIEKALRRSFPHVALLGEEGVVGKMDADTAGWWTRLTERSTSPTAYPTRACPSHCSDEPRHPKPPNSKMATKPWSAWSMTPSAGVVDCYSRRGGEIERQEHPCQPASQTA